MRQPVAFCTLELHGADGLAPLPPGAYALRLCAGQVVGVHGPMRPGPRRALLPHEYAEFPYQTAPALLAAIEHQLLIDAAPLLTAGVGTRRHLALAVSACVFASCALSWLLATA